MISFWRGGSGLPPSTFDSSLVREISPIPFTHSSSVMNSSPNTWFQPLFHHQFRLFLMFSLCRCSRSTPSHFPLFLSGTDVAGFTISVLSTFLYFLHFSVILYCNLFGKPLLQFFFSSVFDSISFNAPLNCISSQYIIVCKVHPEDFACLAP